MRKFLLIGLILAVVASFAFAGGNNQSSAQETISIWSIQFEGDGPRYINAAISRFETANPNIKVNVTFIPNDTYKSMLAVAMAAGRAPDLFISWSGGPMQDYVKNNQIIDLTSYLNANPAFKNKLMDGGIASGTYNGKVYGIPSTNVALAPVFYNKQIFQRLGLSVPTTISELEAVCDRLKANNITPFTLANLTQWTGSMYFMYLVTRHGGTQPFIDAVAGTGSFTHPSFIYAGTKLQEWVNKGYFLQGFNGFDWDSGQGRPPMYRGETAMLVMGSWFASQAATESPEFFANMGMFPFPRVEEGTGDPGTILGTIGDNFYHINSQAKNPAKAFELLTYLLDDQSIKDMIADNKIPPVKGIESLLTEPSTSIYQQVINATGMQFWYDQFLPPEVASVHLVTLQQMLGLTKTPQAGQQELQDAMQAYLRRNR